MTCTGSGDGKVDLTIDGGTGPMNIIWSNLSTTQNISGLAGGTYTVTVTDAYGCVKYGLGAGERIASPAGPDGSTHSSDLHGQW